MAGVLAGSEARDDQGRGALPLRPEPELGDVTQSEHILVIFTQTTSVKTQKQVCFSRFQAVEFGIELAVKQRRFGCPRV
jgi:hypothetical protein